MNVFCCRQRYWIFVLLLGVWAAWPVGLPASAAVPNAVELLKQDEPPALPKIYLEITRSDASVSKVGPLTDRDFQHARILAQTPANKRFTLSITGLVLRDQALGIVLICGNERFVSPRFTQPAGGAAQDAEFDFEDRYDAWRVARGLCLKPTVYPAPLSAAYLQKLASLNTEPRGVAAVSQAGATAAISKDRGEGSPLAMALPDAE